MGNYKGSEGVKNKEFTIRSQEAFSENNSGLEIYLADKIYNKEAVYKSTPYVVLNGTLLKTSDYKVSYWLDPECKKTEMGKNKVSITGSETSKTVYVKIEGKDKGNYTGSIIKSYNVYKDNSLVDISKATVTLKGKDGKKISQMPYTGNEITIDEYVKVEVKGTSGITSNDYDIRYADNINNGKATVIIMSKADGKCVGIKTATFKITSKNINKK
jgi:hypothetical protein